jgi:hypothetical protein
VVLYSAVLGAQHLTVATSTRTYGIRFVKNVLGEESPFDLEWQSWQQLAALLRRKRASKSD